MKKIFNALAAVAALGFSQCFPAQAQEILTAQTVIDKAAIDNLLERYYANFGKAGDEDFSTLNTADAEMDLGTKSYKGIAAIAGMYKGMESSGQSPAAKLYSFIVLVSNKLITVHGDKATAQMIFTEIGQDTTSAPPRLLTIGREYDNLVKVKGAWRITRRQIVSGAKPPEGWVN